MCGYDYEKFFVPLFSFFLGRLRAFVHNFGSTLELYYWQARAPLHFRELVEPNNNSHLSGASRASPCIGTNLEGEDESGQEGPGTPATTSVRLEHQRTSYLTLPFVF